MKLLNRIVVRNLGRRVVLVLGFLIGLAAVSLFYSNDPAGGTIVVKLQPKPETVTQGREMSQYVFGGYSGDCVPFRDYPFDPRFASENQKCRESRESARQFIWEHWRSKKRAYIVISYFCSHCTEEHIFVEPDETGRWNITIRSLNAYYNHHFANNIFSLHAYDVTFRWATSEDRRNQFGSKILVFQNEVGEEVGSL